MRRGTLFLLALLLVASLTSVHANSLDPEPGIIIAHYYAVRSRASLPSWFVIQMIGAGSKPQLSITYKVVDGRYDIVSGLLAELVQAKLSKTPVSRGKPPHVAVVALLGRPEVDVVACAGEVYYYSDGSWIEVSNGLAIRGYIKIGGEAVYFRLAYIEGSRASEPPCAIDFLNSTSRIMLTLLSIAIAAEAARAVITFDVDKLLLSEAAYDLQAY